jgi:deazaflavin-dependent oxidoreductase (nitroreductase family)
MEARFVRKVRHRRRPLDSQQPPGIDALAALFVVSMTDPNFSVADHNKKIIEEFRANGGRVGGYFEGAPLLILHHTGAKSGQERLNPMMYRKAGDAWAVFASKAGAPTNPDWYHNLRAHPDATIEVGTETIAVRARVADSEEREPIWAAQKAEYPGFADYEQKTSREIPVVILERRS